MNDLFHLVWLSGLFDKVEDLAMGCARADDGNHAGHILVFAMRDNV
jgi:hypothetical protein